MVGSTPAWRSSLRRAGEAEARTRLIGVCTCVTLVDPSGSVGRVTVQPTRTPTAVDAIATDHFDAEVALSPITATYLGIPGSDDRLDDVSPQGLAAVSEARRTTLARLATAA